MKVKDLDVVIPIIRNEVKKWGFPVVSRVSSRTRDPYKVLISCLLSLRTKDGVTEVASRRLFERVSKPEDLLEIPLEELEKIIYPVGFYRNKAKTIKEVTKEIVEKYGGKVPDELDELLKLRGVGRKTANLVLIKGYGKPAICVDTHVHRISNRWGLVDTKNPEETEMMLRKILPRKYWMEYNDLLVPFGQNICLPTSPFCSKCPIVEFCSRKGVERSR